MRIRRAIKSEFTTAAQKRRYGSVRRQEQRQRFLCPVRHRTLWSCTLTRRRCSRCRRRPSQRNQRSMSRALWRRERLWSTSHRVRVCEEVFPESVGRSWREVACLSRCRVDGQGEGESEGSGSQFESPDQRSQQPEAQVVLCSESGMDG